jgi:hypothetical protein
MYSRLLIWSTQILCSLQLCVHYWPLYRSVSIHTAAKLKTVDFKEIHILCDVLMFCLMNSVVKTLILA